LKPKEIDSLIHLLEDPDHKVYAHISARLIEQGPTLIPILERAWESTANDLQQERITDILLYLQSTLAAQGLENWIGHRYHNLLEGAYWLAKQTYPKLHLEDMQTVVNDICKDVWINLQDNMPPEEKVKTLDFFFFRQHHFRLLNNDIFQPKYNYINNVIESRMGNPVALTLLYLHVGQQAGLPLQAVCMPNSFITAYSGDNNEVLFYLHVFHQGAKVFQKDIDLYFNRAKITPKEHYYRPKPNTDALLYLLEMQIYCYEREKNQAKVEQYRRLLPLFGNKSVFNDVD